MKHRESELMSAVVDEDIELVTQILCKCNSKDEIDGAGKSFCTRVGTAMMAAARGNGIGGDAFHNILNIIWSSYKRVTCGTLQGKQMKDILLETDTRHQWNVLMHSAKCGDEKNLKLVLRFYTEVFGDCRLVTDVQDSIDLVHVDHKVKDLISKECFSGSITPICNYKNTRSRRSCTTKRKRSHEVNSMKKMNDHVKSKNGKHTAVEKHHTASDKMMNDYTKSKKGVHAAVEKNRTASVKIESSRQPYSLKIQKLERGRIELLSEDNSGAEKIGSFFLAGTDIENSKGKADDSRSSSNVNHESDDTYLPSADTKKIGAESAHKDALVSRGARHRKKTQAKKRALTKVDDLSKLRNERDSALAREDAALKEIKKLKAALRLFL